MCCDVVFCVSPLPGARFPPRPDRRPLPGKDLAGLNRLPGTAGEGRDAARMARGAALALWAAAAARAQPGSMQRKGGWGQDQRGPGGGRGGGGPRAPRYQDQRGDYKDFEYWYGPAYDEPKWKGRAVTLRAPERCRGRAHAAGDARADARKSATTAPLKGMARLREERTVAQIALPVLAQGQ